MSISTSPHEGHDISAVANKATIASFRALADPLRAAGATGEDYLVALEGVIAGVLLLTIKPQGYDEAISALADGARERLAQAQLSLSRAKGVA